MPAIIKVTASSFLFLKKTLWKCNFSLISFYGPLSFQQKLYNLILGMSKRLSQHVLSLKKCCFFWKSSRTEKRNNSEERGKCIIERGTSHRHKTGRERERGWRQRDTEGERDGERVIVFSLHFLFKFLVVGGC